MGSISGIYVIRNKQSNKVYIGQAQNISKRWGEHRRTLKSSKHANRYLQAAWNKYGEKTFEFKVLEYCSIEQLDAREQHFLNVYMPKGICYNLAPEVGTTRGKPCNEETKRRISAAKIGKSISDEHRQKISDTLRGRPLNDNQHAAIIKSNQNRVISDKVKQQFVELHKKQKGVKHTFEHAQSISNALKGHKVSEETRAKIGASNKGKTIGRKQSPELVDRLAENRMGNWIVTSPDGIEHHIKGLARFCRQNGLDQGMMSRIAKSGRAYKGWKCRKVNDA